jgi:hypothetical protein
MDLNALRIEARELATKFGADTITTLDNGRISIYFKSNAQFTDYLDAFLFRKDKLPYAIPTDNTFSF